MVTELRGKPLAKVVPFEDAGETGVSRLTRCSWNLSSY